MGSPAASIAGGGSGGGGVSAGPGTAITDNQAVRGDTAGIQGSLVTIADDGTITTPAGLVVAGDSDFAGAVTAAQLDVDNLRLNANTLSATDANGSLVLSPNGTGSVVVPNGSAAAPGLRFTDDGATATGLVGSASHWLLFASGGSVRVALDGNSGNLGLTSTGQLRFASAADPSSSHDAGFYRSAAAEIGTSNFAGAPAGLLCSRPVEASTAGAGSPNLLAGIESRKLVSNEGATAEAYNTLPAAAPGLEFAFYCADTDGIRVTANGTDTIRLAGSVSAAGGRIQSTTQGSYVVLVCPSAAIGWVGATIVGTWSVT